MKNFVILIDDEVVGNYTISDEQLLQFNMDKTIAIFSSDPRFIPNDKIIAVGSTWNGKNFTAPVE